MMDIRLYTQMLEIDSTSGRERVLADFLAENLLTGRNRVERFDVRTMAGDLPEGCALPQNLLFSWGTPKVFFCSHLDTVPPYIPPTVYNASSDNPSEVEEYITGRGTCDAKGQIFAMWEACKALEAKGYTDFGLLLLAGEETGSFGAKAFNDMMPDDSSNLWVIVGEPTDNCMATAAKGTKSFEVSFKGKAFHSG